MLLAGQAQTAGVDQQTGDAGVDQAPVEGDQRLLVQLKQARIVPPNVHANAQLLDAAAAAVDQAVRDDAALQQLLPSGERVARILCN